MNKKLVKDYMDEQEALEFFGGSCIIHIPESKGGSTDEVLPADELLLDPLDEKPKGSRKSFNDNLLDYEVGGKMKPKGRKNVKKASKK